MRGWGPVSLEHAHKTLRGALLGDGRGVWEARWWDGGQAQRHFLDVQDPRRFTLVRWLGEDREVELFVVPRARAPLAYASQSSALWARVEGTKQWRALLAFRPAPTIILREGASSRADAIWGLDRALSPDWARKGSERLAYALRASRKFADPDTAVIHPPGSCLRDGRTHPVPVVVHSCTDEIYSARQVVGRLKEPPDPNAWREKVAA